jgi:hypothetical protein
MSMNVGATTTGSRPRSAPPGQRAISFTFRNAGQTRIRANRIYVQSGEL